MIITPNKERTVDVLLDVARRAALGSRASHPEDIAAIMTEVIDHGAEVLAAYHQSLLLDDYPPGKKD